MKAETTLGNGTSIVSRLKAGDHDAFDTIYAQFHGSLYRHAYQLTQDEDDSHEIVQYIFVNLWTNRKNLDANRNLLAYLHKSVHYAFLEQLRNRKTFSKYEQGLRDYLQQEHNTVDELLFEKELIARIRNLATDIPGKAGQAFVYYHLEGYNYQQISEMLGVSEKTVKNLLAKSAKDIRLHLGLSILILCMAP
ncbi:RNA polymerase sigma-70 factor [Parapedobacter pyrenivorans]|uniref:RNA polymerase sigma-70 factor n=1 Tax=Parapedobacter pyrenivorans TaxID=1305674 RepID=A0A917I140_9SPHI|nr:sigma-70 family RNA polymerase sigma factor [Parapedobacter pyrenivorans]GGH01851.1 RNA polymerase sigma-70 factor [Parapedobacter pyrenivorans]